MRLAEGCARLSPGSGDLEGPSPGDVLPLQPASTWDGPQSAPREALRLGTRGTAPGGPVRPTPTACALRNGHQGAAEGGWRGHPEGKTSQGPGPFWRGRKQEPRVQSGTEILNPVWMRSKNHVPPCLVGGTSFRGHPRFRDMQTHSRVAPERRGVPTAALPTCEPHVFAPMSPRMDGGARWGWALRCPGRLWGRGSVARL